MSRYFVSASKDASIYEVWPNRNTGKDEILEIGKYYDTVTEENGGVRSLIYFELNQITGSITGSSVIKLNMVVANSEKLRTNQLIFVRAVSRSWDEGSGYFLQDKYVSSDGVTWRVYQSGSYWNASGSDTISGIISSGSSTDVNETFTINVYDVVNPMLTGTIPNHGLLLTTLGSGETDPNNRGNIKVFSKDTHTVHEPFLELLYSDETFVTGSTVSVIPNLDIEISPRNLMAEYKKGEMRKLYFTIRDKYPQRLYSSGNIFANKYYLPSTTQYSIVDVGSGRTIIPFDAYSLIQCDATNGNYVIIDTTPLFVGRFYELQLKIMLGGETFFSKKYGFKVS